MFYLATGAVVDGREQLTEVPGFEAEGELLIGGIGVAVGYLHAPDLTKEVRYSGLTPSLG